MEKLISHEASTLAGMHMDDYRNLVIPVTWEQCGDSVPSGELYSRILIYPLVVNVLLFYLSAAFQA